MIRSTSADKKVLLLHTYLDGELDHVTALSVEQQMSMEPALAAEYERIKSLHRFIHDRLPREMAPARLRARIEARVRNPRNG
jgi:anti-sigma factor RsiW